MNYPSEINLQAYQYEKNNRGKSNPNRYGAYRAGAKGLAGLVEPILNSQQLPNDYKVRELQRIFNEIKNL